jgi:hypothetical protein
MKHVALAFTLSALALATACASSTKTIIEESDPTEASSSSGGSATGKKDAGASADETASSSSSSGGSSSSSSGSSSGGAGACGGEATYDACITCCEQAHPNGASTYIGSLVTCLCKPANCGTSCSTTLCAATPTNPDATCNTCANSKSANCGTDVQSACSADPDCVDFAQCLQTAACDQKP